MTDLIIRRLTPADAAVYRALRLRALREHPDAFTSDADEEAAKPLSTQQKRLEATAQGKLWGAFEGGTIVGMVGLDRETRVKNRHKATLVGMYVAPEAARRGVGKALVETVLAQARSDGIELLVLTVTAGNRGARELYVRAGFATFGVEPGAIRVDGVPHDKEHMYLNLTPTANTTTKTP